MLLSRVSTSAKHVMIEYSKKNTMPMLRQLHQVFRSIGMADLQVSWMLAYSLKLSI